ncbi:MAG: hypothetical protein ACLR9P_05905 [Escherichia coli]
MRVEALLEKLKTLPARSIVLLHPAAINPTVRTSPMTSGCRHEVLKDSQPDSIDIAYQGFGAGMEDDAYAIRAVASAACPCR